MRNKSSPFALPLLFSTVALCMASVATAQPSHPPVQPNGLVGEYFSNRDLSGSPTLVRYDSNFDIHFGSNPPAAGMPRDNFSVRWTGYIVPQSSGSYTFCGYRDNGLRLWIDNELVVNEWNDGWGDYKSRPIRLTANRKHTIKIEFNDRDGAADLSLKWRTPFNREEYVPAASLFPASAGHQMGPRHPAPVVDRPPEPVIDRDRRDRRHDDYPDRRDHRDFDGRRGNGTGLLGEYFDNMNLQGRPREVRVDSTINFNWNFSAPMHGIPSDRFSVRWTGQIEPLRTDSYVFTGHQDDGLRIWVDGRLIVDEWRDADKIYTSSPIRLEANRKYDIRIEYFENAAAADLTLKWRASRQPEEIVPSSQLYPADRSRRQYRR